MSLATRSRRFLRSANSFFMFSLKSLDSKPNLTRMSTRSYHSYPDPNEKPNITYAKANAQKTLNKQDKEFQLDNRFKLDNLFPGTPISKGISKENAPKTIVSTLDNGLTVASQEMPGLMSSFAFLVKAGSAFEIQQGDDTNTGAVQFLELSAFRSTRNRPDRELITEVENLGGMVQCMANKDSIVYFVDILRQHAEKALDILSDTIFNPNISESELEEVKSIIQFQNVMSSADALSREAALVAAYAGTSLGNSHICPLERVELVDRSILEDFRSKYYFAENCIISGVGIDHASMVELVSKKFSALRSISSSKASIASTKRAGAKFSGSLVKNERKLQEPFVKVAICFEAGNGWSDSSLIPLCVLQTLLGGGKSFSAGGPGKGMYTRLYTQMLNRHHWAEAVESFISVHDESAVLGIDGACDADYVQDLIKEIVEQMTKLAFEPVSDEELTRAKNMLKSMMMMQLESRLVVCEDIVRQFATYGKRESPSVVCEKIDAVTKEDLLAVGRRMLLSAPAVGCVGEDLSNIPPYEIVQRFTENHRKTAYAPSFFSFK